MKIMKPLSGLNKKTKGRNYKKLWLEDPQAFEQFVRKSGQSRAHRVYQEELLKGPHPSPEALFEYAVSTPVDKERNEWLSHIALCPSCADEVFLIQEVQERLEEAPWSEHSEDVSLSSIFGELISKVQISIKSLARKFVKELKPEPIPVLRTALAGAWQLQTYGPYSCLTSILMETREFVVGDQALFSVEIPEDGYVMVWMLSEADLPSLIFQSSPAEKTSVRGAEVKDIELTVSGSPGHRKLKAVWTLHEILDPKGTGHEAGYDQRALSVYARWLTELPETELRIGTCDFLVKEARPEFLIEPISQDASVTAVRVIQPGEKDSDYWVPLLFGELRSGKARFGWSISDAADLNQLASEIAKVGEADLNEEEKKVWKHGKFLLELKPGDFLIYINMPAQDECTVVELLSDYNFGESWDPHGYGDFRHVMECKCVGTFNRNPALIHPDLLRRLKLRGSHWSLKSVKKHVKVVLAGFRSSGSQ